MSSKVATLIVGLLAIAEGRSDDRNLLREANVDDVLDVISPEMLDRIAKQLYAEDDENMSAYERLLKSDKRRKMDYLNNIRPDLIHEDRERHQAAEEEHIPLRHADDHVQDHYYDRGYSNETPTAEQLDRTFRRTEDTHQRLTERREMAEAERHSHLQEKEQHERRRQHRESHYDSENFHHEQTEFNVVPETRRGRRSDPVKAPASTPVKKNKKKKKHDKEAKYQQELLKQAEERKHKEEERQQRLQEEREKQIQEQLDDERKEQEERQKRVEEQKRRREDSLKRRHEEALKREESVEKARRETELDLAKRHEQTREERNHRTNSILDKYPNLNRSLNLQAAAMESETNPITLKPFREPKKDKNDWVQQDTEFVIEPRFKDHYTLSEEDLEAEAEEIERDHESEEDVPIIEKREHDLDSHTDDHEKLSHESLEKESNSSESSSSSASSSSSLSSSSSSTSSMSSEELDLYMQKSHMLAEHLHQGETRSEGSRHERHHQIATEHSDSSDLTFDSDRNLKVPVIAHHDSESEHIYHQKEALRDLHDKYEEEIAAVQSDEDHYFAHYSRLEEDMKHMAEAAEKVKEEAIHEADEAHERAVSAQQKVKEAEERAAELERQAKEAEQRLHLYEEQAKLAEDRVKTIEEDWHVADSKAHDHEMHLREAQRHAEDQEMQRIHEEQLAHRREGDHHYRRPHYSSESEQDGIPMNQQYEPIEYMKHDGRRHKQLTRERKEERQAVKRALQDPETRRRAREAMKDPEVRKKVFQEIKEDYPELQRAIDDEKEEQRKVQKKKDRQGKWGHIETVYPEGYDGPRYETDYTRRNPDRDDHERRSRDLQAPPRPKTVYPLGYIPPTFDDEPQEIARGHTTKPVYKRDPAQRIAEMKQRQFGRGRRDDIGASASEEFDLTEHYHDHHEHQPYYAEEAHMRYDHHYDGAERFMNLQDTPNEALGSALIEENEKERALEIFRVHEEQELKEEYDHKIMELTGDYKLKLRDLDKTYHEKKTDLERARESIEREASFARDTMTGHRYALDDPNFSVDPAHETLHRVDPMDEPVNRAYDYEFVEDRPRDFDFQIMDPVYGFNLAQKSNAPLPSETTKDPLTDIKRRERDLQHERLARESELQREYEKRLQEFELDYQQKERELEKEKLYQERKMIAEREREIEKDNIDAKKKRKDLLGDEKSEFNDDQDEVNSENMHDEDDDDDDDESESDEDDIDLSSDSSEMNGRPAEFTEEEDEVDPYEPHHKAGDEDVYEIEWELDLVPKRVVPKTDRKTAEPTKPDRKSKKSRKDKKSKRESRRNVEPQHKPSRHHHRNERPTTHHKHRSHKNQEDQGRHRHRHRRNGIGQVNELSYGMQYRHGDNEHYPVVTEGHGEIGHDVYGNEYKYESYRLPQPKMPQVPIARMPVRPERPAHPLGYDTREEELSLVTLLKPRSDEEVLTKGPTYGSKQKAGSYAHTEHEALPTKQGQYPHQKTGPSVLKGAQFDLQRESYGPQFHDRTPELIEESHSHKPYIGPHHEELSRMLYDHKKEIEYDLFSHQYDRPIHREQHRDFEFRHVPDYESHYGYENAMSTRTFPKVKTYKYDPAAMAKELEKARSLGNKPEEKPSAAERTREHRRQTRAFDLGPSETQGESTPAHGDHDQMFDQEDEHKEKSQKATTSKTTETEKLGKGLQPQVPKKIQKKHVTDLPEQPPKPSALQKPHEEKPIQAKGTPKQQFRKPEQKQDDMPAVDLSSFQAKRDPMGIDFEKIAMKRAAKQALFRRKEEDESTPWDNVHGGRYTYSGQHKPEDREMTESPIHAALDKAFQQSEEEYHQHQFMKPAFKDFQLQFQSPKQQVSDQIPSDQVAQDNEEEMPRGAHASYAESSRSEQRRLEELGINFDDYFYLESKPSDTKKAKQDRQDKQVKQDKQAKKPKQVEKKAVKETEKKKMTPRKPADKKRIKPETQKVPLQQVAEPKRMPKSKSFIPTEPPTFMMSPYTAGPVDRTDVEDPLELDAAKEKKLRKQASQYGVGPQASTEVLEDPSQHHFYQGQQHHKHKFSLMDPVHPAVHREQEQVYDEHFAGQATEEQPMELPVFDPSLVMRKQEQMQGQYSGQQQTFTKPTFGGYQPQQQEPVRQAYQQPFYPQATPMQQQQRPQYGSQAPVYPSQQYQQPQQPYYPQQTEPLQSYFPTAPQQQAPQAYPQASMYQAPQPWYASQPQQPQQSYQMPSAPQQPSQQQQWATQPQVMPQATGYLNPQLYPSTPYMPPELMQQGSSFSTQQQAASVTPTKSLPYQPRSQEPTRQEPVRQEPVRQEPVQQEKPRQQPLRQEREQTRSSPVTQTQQYRQQDQQRMQVTPTSMTPGYQPMAQQPYQAPAAQVQPATTWSSLYGGQSPSQGSYQEAPAITMTRDLTQGGVTPTRSLMPGRRNQLPNYSVEDRESTDFSHGDYEDTHHSYHGDEHPVIVTGTSPDAYVAHEGDEFIVSDSDHGLGEQVVEELGELSSWFHGSSYFLESKNDLEAARLSNSFLQ